jgi:nitrogen fixation/metabolism regulation signal transduction histidine kinase
MRHFHEQWTGGRSVKKPAFFPLRYRFMLISSLMLILLLSTLTLVLGVLQTRTIQGRIETRGLDMARNLAAVSRDYLVTYNYVALERLANQMVDVSDIRYVVFYDKEGRVAGYSRRPDLQNRILSDEISRRAVSASVPLVVSRSQDDSGRPAMHVAVPVFLTDSQTRWGTIRICLSLDLMQQQIRQILWTIGILGVLALGAGMLISNWAARQVTRPLGKLVATTQAVTRGDLAPDIAIHTRDEVEILADNFLFMIQEVLAQKKKLEDQLREIQRLQEYTEKVLITMGDGLLAIDMAGRITTINPAARKILEIPDNLPITSLPVWDLVDTATQIAGYIREVMSDPSGKKQRELGFSTGDHDRMVLVNAGILETSSKTAREIIFTLNDITALKRLEAGIRQAGRLADLGTVAAGMAHEIRNPLSAIKTFVALLPQKLEKPGFLEKFQQTVPREINRLNTLIEEMLELSRQPRYDLVSTDMRALVVHCRTLLEADFKRRHIYFQTDLPEDLGRVQADADQLEKAVINLLQNGAQAIAQGGNIRISGFCDHDWVVLDFEDTGHGMPLEVAEHIFTPFYTTKVKGTGLGLAITHKVITEHGGQISLETHEGAGTCFRVRLPRILADPVPVPCDPASDPGP